MTARSSNFVSIGETNVAKSGNPRLGRRSNESKMAGAEFGHICLEQSHWDLEHIERRETDACGLRKEVLPSPGAANGVLH